jgi:hypothetical protein
MKGGGAMSVWRRGVAGAWAVAAFVVFVALCVAPGTADAHRGPYDSVDDCEIRWEDHTRYDAERQAAQNAWEELKGDNCVDLLPDAWHTVADLVWVDRDYPSASWAGRYYWGPVGAETLALNTFYMETYTPCQRRTVAMHELGHAHGIGHGPRSGNVMSGVLSNQCVLGAHDIADYEEFWGSRNPPPYTPSTPSTHTP